MAENWEQKLAADIREQRRLIMKDPVARRAYMTNKKRREKQPKAHAAFLYHHWTNASTKDYLLSILWSFVDEIYDAIEDAGEKGRLQRVLSRMENRINKTPEDVTVFELLKIAKKVRQELALVTYKYDKVKEHGPIYAPVFAECWKKCRKPGWR